MAQEQIHRSVQERYGRIATSEESCCGGGECSPVNLLYSDDILSELPADISSFSLGCGDPVGFAGITEGETVLDLGSGAGMDCFLAAQRVGAAGRVIGVDMTPEMLTRAERNREKLGLANVEFRRGQIEALPVEDDTVDLILSNCVINLSPDKPAVFREAYRVLKPGGRLSVSDIVTDRPFSEAMAADADSWAACVAGAIPLDEYIGMLADAGFEGIEATDKFAATEIVDEVADGPRLFSARITAVKPLG